MDFEAIKIFLNENLSPHLYLKPPSDIMTSTALSQPLLVLSWPLLALSLLWPPLHSDCLYMTFSGSPQALSCLYTNFKASTGTPSNSKITLMASTSTLLMASMSPLYNHYLTTSTHSHGFYNNHTASVGTLKTSTVILTASICTLTASIGTCIASSTLTRPILTFSVSHQHL
jgi:hypothetical protein